MIRSMPTKNTAVFALVIAMATTAVGCGASAPKGDTSPARYAGNEGTVNRMSADAPPSASSPQSPAAVQPGYPGGGSYETAQKSASPEPSTRQGLGTEWGETRDSRITHTHFDRADWSRPFATLTMQYNDRLNTSQTRDLARADGGEVDMSRGFVTVSVRDDRDGSFETFLGRDRERAVVLGRAGDAYTIVVHNRSPHRFEVVASVDGLDVIDGKTADFSHRGYILRSYGEVRIDGFRQSSASVAAFRFGSVSDSYAAQTGTARNVGVIGIALFGERGDRLDDAHEQYLRDTANPFPNAGYARPPHR